MDEYSGDLAKEISWFQSAHSRLPPKSPLAAISLYYSKLNDNRDSFVARIHDPDRTFTEQIRDFARFFLGSFLSLSRLLLSGFKNTLRQSERHSISTGSYNVLVDYVGVNNKRIIGTQEVKSDIEVTFHSSDPAELVNKLMATYRFSDALCFIAMLLRISLSLPIIKGHLFESFIEKTRELTNQYLFQFYLVAKYFDKCDGNLWMLFEDQPRDRLLINMLKDKFHITGLVHSPALNFYRYNLLYSESDILLPDDIICSYQIKAVNLSKYKRLKCSSSESALPFRDSSQDFSSCDSILICLPNNQKVIDELLDLAGKLSVELKYKIYIKPHPLTNKELPFNTITDVSNSGLTSERTIVVSSFMTNVGYYLKCDGFKVLYVGSSKLPWYNPFPGSSIKFVKTPFDAFELLES